ncbi:unnamed protein product [Closterium sp. NIES-54]
MASPLVLAFDAEGRPVKFETWLDDLHLFLQLTAKDDISLYDHALGHATAPAPTADSTARSQWQTRDAHARFAICNSLPIDEREHFGQHKTAQELYTAVVARYSSPASAALGRLSLPYLFPDLASFHTVADLITHLRTSEARFRAAMPDEFLAKNPPPLWLTLYHLVTRFPDTLRSIRDHFLARCPTELTISLLEKELLAAEASIVAVGASRGDPRTPFFEGCSPSPLLPSVASAAAVHLLGTEKASVLPSRNAPHLGAGPGGAEPGGAEPGCAGPGSTEPGGAAPQRPESPGSESGGPKPEGPAPVGALSSEQLREWYFQYCFLRRGTSGARRPTGTGAGASTPRKELPSCERIRDWYERRCTLRSGAPGVADPAAAGGATGTGDSTGSAGAAAPEVGAVPGALDPGVGATTGAADPGTSAVAGAEDSGVGAAAGTADPGVGAATGAEDPGVGAATGTADPGIGATAGATDSGAGAAAGAEDPGVGAAADTEDPGAGAAAGAVELGVGATAGAEDPDACVSAGGPGAVPAVSGVTAQPRPYFVPLLQQVLGLSPSTGPPPPLECPLPVPSQFQLQPVSSLPAPSPYTGPTGGLAERREPASRPASPVRAARTSGRSPRQRPPPSSPPVSSLPALTDPASDSLRAASPTVVRLLANVVTDPSFESTAASALVAELVDFAARCRLDSAASLVAESESVCPPSVGGECALGTDVLEDRQEEFQCLAAASPHLVSVLLTPEGDPDALDIPTPRSYAEAIEGTYVDEVPPPGANIVSGMWIFRVKRPPGSLPIFKARYVARGFTLGFAPSFADPLLFLRTDTSLLPFYVLVYVDDLVFATADTAGLAYVKSELQKRHTCTDLGELRSYLGLQITRDRARRTITLTQSHMVQQVLQRFGFTYSSPQATPLPARHSLSALPSDESVESSGPYPELVGCLMYLMTCTRPDLAYPLSILARYVAPGRHRPEHMAAAKRVLRYLCNTSGMGLVLGGRSPVVLTGHADASWADD